MFLVMALCKFLCVFFFFFFKQKTAYEMRISDWSSDVCSSDLRRGRRAVVDPRRQPADASHDRAVRRRRLQDLPHLRAGARAVTAATGGEARFTVLVLAGDRGPQDPVSTAAGVAHKCLAPVVGRAMLARVVAEIGRAHV